MKKASTESNLKKIQATVAPPAQPAGIGRGSPVENTPALPNDFTQFVRLYGSGSFENGGTFLTVLNPFEKHSAEQFDQHSNSISNLVKGEGEDYIPYKLHPAKPGLLLWGYGEDRKHFFWLTKGNPEEWTVVAMHDLEICTPFDMPMVEFLKQLLCSELDCSFIGGVETDSNRIEPGYLKFNPKRD